MVPLLVVLTLIFLAFLWPTSAATASQPETEGAEPWTEPELRQELLAMREADQSLRAEFLADPDTYGPELAALDTRHSKRAKEILEKHGWPTSDEVGSEGSEALWLIVQHSPDEELQRRALPLMEEAARRGDLDPASVALTVDRIRMNAGEPQLYGSQFHQVDGEWVVWPIEDEEHLDERREKMGLGPFEEYRRLILEMMSGSSGNGEAPDDS